MTGFSTSCAFRAAALAAAGFFAFFSSPSAFLLSLRFLPLGFGSSSASGRYSSASSTSFAGASSFSPGVASFSSSSSSSSSTVFFRRPPPRFFAAGFFGASSSSSSSSASIGVASGALTAPPTPPASVASPPPFAYASASANAASSASRPRFTFPRDALNAFASHGLHSRFDACPTDPDPNQNTLCDPFLGFSASIASAPSSSPRICARGKCHENSSSVGPSSGSSSSRSFDRVASRRVVVVVVARTRHGCAGAPRVLASTIVPGASSAMASVCDGAHGARPRVLRAATRARRARTMGDVARDRRARSERRRGRWGRDDDARG